MDVGDLPLAPEYVEHFRAQGIEELYPPQAAAVEAGVTEGERVVAAVPTASGKTFVAQLAMLTADGPALFVVPLRALATEKYEAFDDLPGLDVGIATGDFDARDVDLADHDVVVATSEKVDAAVRQGAEWVADLACVVVDEIHLLDADGRGPTLEVTIAKLRRLAPGVQVVGLSATVGNAAAVADWLDATLVESDWRPVDLRAGTYADGVVTFRDGTTRDVPAADTSATTALVRDAVDDGGGCLVFVASRRAAQGLAMDLADEGFAFPAEVVEEVRSTALTETGESLARCVSQGVAFHHAGLRSAHRSAVERAFRERDLKVICATPTLAAGVNVPARRVVVRDHERYTDDGPQDLPVLEVHQMFGRAGRPHLDPYGEAVLVATGGDEQRLRERYLDGEPEPVASKLAEERALRTHVLATVASGFADSRAALDGLLAETFYAHQEGVDSLAAATDDALAYLDGAGMLDRGAGAGSDGGDADDGDLAATPLGDLVSRVYVDPLTGADVVAALRRAAGMDRVTPLTVLELVCDTDEMRGNYVRGSEAGRLSDLAMRREAELTKPVREFEGDFQSWLRSLKTACLLEDLADGVGVDEVTERYGVGPGDVRRTAERAAWLLTATESLADHLDAEADAVQRVIRETRVALEGVEA